MKAGDISKVNEIDLTIMGLLDQLATLYEKRAQCFSAGKNRSTSSKKSSKNDPYADLDLSSFDLSLKD